MEESKHSVVSKLFSDSVNNGTTLKVCAPMVRYSSLPFRHLVKLYKCDLTFTHMMLSDCFSKVCENLFQMNSQKHSDKN